MKSLRNDPGEVVIKASQYEHEIFFCIIPSFYSGIACKKGVKVVSFYDTNFDVGDGYNRCSYASCVQYKGLNNKHGEESPCVFQRKSFDVPKNKMGKKAEFSKQAEK